jgi:hypothetical protein
MENNEMHQNQGEMKMEGASKRRWHWGCCILPVVSLLFWLAAIVFVVIVWTSVIRQQPVGNYPAEWWIVNALMFGVLALFGRGRRIGSCRGGCCCGKCGVGGKCPNCGSPDGKCVCR